MGTVQTVAEPQRDEILKESVEQNRQALITHLSDDGWRMYKSCFVRGGNIFQTILARISNTPSIEKEELPAAGDTLGVTFRLGHKKCMFRTVLEKIKHDPSQVVFTLTWPDNLQQLQRRVFERAAPPSDMVVAVRFLRLDANTSVEKREVRNGQLEDLSAGGIRIRASRANETVLGATYRCVFSPRPGAPALVVDAILRHREAKQSGRASLGFKFMGLETSPEGQRTMERIVRMVKSFQQPRGRRRF